jgi:hypothetical protein
MLKRCCCFDLRTGSVWIGALRWFSWLFILLGSTYLCWQLFVLGHRGMVPFTVMQNLEDNGKIILKVEFYFVLNILGTSRSNMVPKSKKYFTFFHLIKPIFDL